jgi:hypothetical protein
MTPLRRVDFLKNPKKPERFPGKHYACRRRAAWICG